jgi:NAD-dependent SIR2 family protein deacetylase
MNIAHAAAEIAAADALLVGAGAGMGVDSGLPDFRGTQGFWRAYPAYEKLGLRFEELASPRWFQRDPALAWGFYGHRLNLYRKTRPHEGFAILARWASRMRHGAFAFTSNVDGQFQRAGFADDRVWEIHGAIEHLQCLSGCGVGLFAAGPDDVTVDPDTFRATGELPRCPDCRALARPAILMFGDAHWDDARSRVQRDSFESWFEAASTGRIAVVECGAGTAIPSVRSFCEGTAREVGGKLVRINPREPEVPPGGHVGLPMGALAGLRAIDQAIAAR